MIKFGDDQIEEQLKNVNERIMYTNYSAEHCTVCFKTVNYITSKSGLDVSHSFSNAAKQANIFFSFPIHFFYWPSGYSTSLGGRLSPFSGAFLQYLPINKLYISKSHSPIPIFWPYFLLKYPLKITSTFQFSKVFIQTHRKKTFSDGCG